MTSLRISGSPPSKANSYRMVPRKGGGTAMIKLRPVVAYEQAIVDAFERVRTEQGLPTPLFPAQEPVTLELVWHRSTMVRRDLDNIYKAVLDALTTAKVWGDDSQVTHIDGRMAFDAEDGEEWLEIAFAVDPRDPGARWHKHHREKARALARALARESSPPPSTPPPKPATKRSRRAGATPNP